MQTKLKTDLFRFITLRAPQLISKQRRTLGFIEHPDPQQSAFLKKILNENDPEKARAALNTVAETFTPLASVSTLKSLAPELWAFSLWLGEYKNSLPKAELETELPAGLPGQKVLLTVWDNLYYDILTQRNATIRQACLQLIIAWNFVEKYKPAKTGAKKAKQLQNEYNEAETLELHKRIANGKVVIHSAFTARKISQNPGVSAPASAGFRKQETQHVAFIAGQKAQQLEAVQAEFRAYDKQYQADYNQQFQLAYGKYTADVDRKVAQYLARTDSPKQKMPAATEPPVPSPGTSLLEDQIPEGLVPEFTFRFDSPFSPGYSKGKLSQIAQDFIRENHLEDAPVREAMETLGAQLRELQKLTARNYRKRTKDILVNGVLVRPNSSGAHDFTLSFKQEPVLGKRQAWYSVFFSLNAGYRGSFIRDAKWTLMVGEKILESKEILLLANDADTLFAQIFSDTQVSLPERSRFVFKAELELNTGKRLKLETEGILAGTLLTSGSAIPVPPVGMEPVIPHYGVTKLGIADYRKVEQELCCYVAGEVSHIENILAKEYKEKSTRNLTSSESILESTTERELEDLTDTATTTRHEMSTEIAEIVSRDRSSNLGFSAGVNGEYLKQQYNAGVYGDFAFAQSTSDSNSVARTYAEDVTRRALERILQKSTVKRTARLLQEYEMNIRHGFDNRNGENHVTGVYRWVDKVYKNRLINYDKHLMYEFMVPEPGRFYKQAIIVKAEEESETPATSSGSTGNTGVAIKPDHPSEHGLADANSVTRDNYNAIASIYGASVAVPPNEYSTVSGSYSQSIGTTDKEQAFSYNDIMVPQDYQCTQINGTVAFNYKAKVGAKAYIKVNAAGKLWERTEMRGESSETQSFSHSINNIEGAIAVTVTTKKITSFNLAIEAKCQIKSPVFQQWQQDAYDSIMQAYEQKLQSFQDAQGFENLANQSTTPVAAEASQIDRNPLFNANIVKTELKRLCIEMLTRPFGIPQGADFYQNGDCEVPQLKLDGYLDKYASWVKFFEQAFHWEIMSYIFYPYFWAKRCDWVSLFQSQDSIDYIFQEFIQSGMGRVVVPVRKGFEEAVVYYMETGEVWLGSSIVLDTNDELYLSIVDELSHLDGAVEETWETVVPSSLTIVQARSVLLDEGGLPCCETDEDVLTDLNLKPDKNTLQLLKE